MNERKMFSVYHKNQGGGIVDKSTQKLVRRQVGNPEVQEVTRYVVRGWVPEVEPVLCTSTKPSKYGR